MSRSHKCPKGCGNRCTCHNDVCVGDGHDCVATPLEALRHHVTGAIERGEATAITEQPGEIWQPGFICTKPVAYRVNVPGAQWPTSNTIEPETLREALVSVTSDGDFRSCGLLDGAVIKVTRVNKAGTKRARYWRIRFACQATDDMLSECAVEEFEDVEV